MAEPMIECPECKTQYTMERCGAPKTVGIEATVKCLVCACEFDARITKAFPWGIKIESTRRVRPI